MSLVKTYTPEDVDILIAGYRVEGFNSITITPSVPRFAVRRGARGMNTRIRATDTSVTIAVTLNMMSNSNTVLSELVRQQESGNLPALEVVFKDFSTKSQVQSNKAFILSYPDMSFESDSTDRVWEIFCLTTSRYVVGSGEGLRERLKREAATLGNSALAEQLRNYITPPSTNGGVG